MDAKELFEGYTAYTDAAELAAEPETDEAPATTIVASVATALLTYKEGC